MFSAIVYQLNSSGVCDFDSKALTQAVVDYLQANQARYCDFVCQPVDQHDDYNADTDPITQEDEFVSTITDPQLQTESAADLKWPDMIQTIARQYGVHFTDEVARLPFDDKSNWIKHNPVTAARHFQYRLNAVSQDFLKSTAKPLGEIADYAIRIEFQARGSPKQNLPFQLS